jgi:prefoldin subunit 5
MVEIKNIFNRAIEHVVDICDKSITNVEKSQNSLMLSLSELESRLKAIADLNDRMSDSKMTEACQSIQIYKSKIDRIKTRLLHLKKRLSLIESKLASKPS